MTLSEYIKENLTDSFSALPLSVCRINKEYLIKGAPEASFVIMLAVPYPKSDKGPVASFAKLPDYHEFFTSKEEEITALLFEKYGDVYVKVFSDHSPIDERDGAARCGLGVIGDNELFISKQYGSFVFLGEIICSLGENELRKEGVKVSVCDIDSCYHCGLCSKACPAGCIGKEKTLCISSITQKKGDLSDTERDMIKIGQYVWGCDICALVCPMNKGIEAEYKDFFTSRLNNIESYADIEKMSDEEYAKYPFSWRKKDIIKRNFEILNSAEKE